MNKEIIYFTVKVILSVIVGFLVIYPLYLYGRHFLLP